MSHKHKRHSDGIESILGYDVRTRRQICESSEEDLMDAYRALLMAAKNGGDFEALCSEVLEFIAAFDDMEDDGARIDAIFANLLRAQILSDDLQQQVAAVVHESLKKPHLDGRILTESLDAVEGMADKAYRTVKIARTFTEGASAVESFIEALRNLSPTMAHAVEEDLIQGVLATMKSPEFTKSIKVMIKTFVKSQG